MHWPFPKGKEETGYAYIMTHPGIPCVLWEHYFDDGKKGCIDDLVKLRSAPTPWSCPDAACSDPGSSNCQGLHASLPVLRLCGYPCHNCN